MPNVHVHNLLSAPSPRSVLFTELSFIQQETEVGFPCFPWLLIFEKSHEKLLYKITPNSLQKSQKTKQNKRLES